jgi:peptidoglycan/LPS O-acetylase OafA/YrhL
LKNAATRIPSLDGIRATSLLLVCASHAGFARERIGGFGVNAFFFLSGFLITTLPPFYTVALAAAALTLIFGPLGTLYAPSLIAELLFYFNYYQLYGIHRGIPGLGVVWSLAVEEHFYLLFPLLYMAMQKWLLSWRHQAWLLWGFCAAILAWRCMLVFNMHLGTDRIYPTTDTRIDSILFGCALAVWNNPYADNSAPTATAVLPGRWKYLFLPGAAAALLWCVAFDDPIFQNTVSFSIQGLALSVVFIAAVRFHDWPPFRLLNRRPVVFIGTLSYSLYLVHDIFLQATLRLWPYAHAWQRAVVALTASFLTSWAIYRAMEKPCASLRKQLRDQSAPRGPISEEAATPESLS